MAKHPSEPSSELWETVRALERGTCREPFGVLGMHPVENGGWTVRVFIPWARSVTLIRRGGRTRLEALGEGGFFHGMFPRASGAFSYRLSVEDPDGHSWEVEDPYRFVPTLDEGRIHAFLEGRERRIHEVLGACVMEHEGVRGTRFAVWAPHAAAVALTGDMNDWDGRCHPMRPRGATGVWELFVPGVDSGARYKYEVLTQSGERTDRADPCGRAAELRPATASEVWDRGRLRWADDAWMRRRRSWIPDAAPVSIVRSAPGIVAPSAGRRSPAAGSTTARWPSSSCPT